MDDVVEMHLSHAISATNTGFIRALVRDRMDYEGLDRPPVELMSFHVVIHCTSGKGRHMVDFTDYEMTPGAAIWIRPGQIQRWSDTHDGFDADVVVFGSSSIPDLPLFDGLIGATSVTQLDGDSDRMQQLMGWMSADLEASQDIATAAAVVSVILRLFTRHARGSGDDVSESPGKQLADAFVASLDDNIEQRSVAWHARNIGASTRSVARATAEALGQRPKEVVDARVILEARRRLAWSDDDVATIARSLRFSEASNFTKFFRTRTGDSPSAFREAVAALA